MTSADWLDCCALISQLWPHKPLDPQAAEAWYPLLADLAASDVTAAINAIALDPANTWPPSLGQLRAAAEPPERPWEDALADLRILVAGCGGIYAREVPKAADPALNDVIAAYGWRAICNLEAGDSTVRAQFRDAYRSAQRRQREQSRRGVAARALTAASPTALPGGSS